jgi:hypothetical protein
MVSAFKCLLFVVGSYSLLHLCRKMLPPDANEELISILKAYVPCFTVVLA